MSDVPCIRVLLADDHSLLRKGIASILAEESDIEVVGEASNGQEAIDRATELMPDILLMDVAMPGMGGLEATRQIKERLPYVRIVMLTVSEEHQDLVQAIKYGAQGYLLKKIEPRTLVECLRGMMRGEAPVSPTMAGRLLAEFAEASRPAAQASHPTTAISPREREILSRIAQGRSNKQIGIELDLAQNTVKNHLKNILAKLQLENRVQAAIYAWRHGLGTPSAE